MLHPSFVSSAEDRPKMAVVKRSGTVEIPLGVGFCGSEARKRFVEQGDDSLLFGEWGNGNRRRTKIVPADTTARRACVFRCYRVKVVSGL